ncbi:Periplasmic protein TonB [Methylacidimicrobium sp. AP8]|uniref:energy transducer TonB n=1 Tax=Methylacidimicrobium sp. AP8 TaxID=2730359 RepID=UPI0018C0D588|nr:energy transducer TonB [Methylacidimicrobium sp. AP8]CAB4242734.1 Periplasmic protein TonB [Methylacidimicrobium sp. AP8]
MTSRTEPRHPSTFPYRILRHGLACREVVPLGHIPYPIDEGLRLKRWACLCVLFFFGLLLAVGTLDKHQSIVDLLLRGAVTPVASPPQEEATSPPIEVEFTPPPPPEPNPEFIQPKQQPLPIPPPVEKTPEPKPEPPKPTPLRVSKKPAPIAPVHPIQRYAAAAPRVGDANTPKPPYPYEAAMRRYQGTVELSLTIQQGRLLDVEVVRSSGFGILDSTARQWIRQHWRLPANLSGTYTIPIIYRLQ